MHLSFIPLYLIPLTPYSPATYYLSPYYLLLKSLLPTTYLLTTYFLSPYYLLLISPLLTSYLLTTYFLSPYYLLLKSTISQTEFTRHITPLSPWRGVGGEARNKKSPQHKAVGTNHKL